MKYLMLISILVVALTSASCRKANCWKCTTIFTSSEDPFYAIPGTSGGRVKYCDKTEAEIRQIEKDGTTVQTYTKNGKTYSSSAATTCK